MTTKRWLPALFTAAAFASGCSTLSTTPGGVPIDTRYSSVNQDSRVLFLVLHYTVADLAGAIKVLTLPGDEVKPDPRYSREARAELTDVQDRISAADNPEAADRYTAGRGR